MGRRTDNPLTILVMGLFSVAFFGGVVVYFNETKPILKLKPELRGKYGEKEFVTRFVPSKGLNPSYIVVDVPKDMSDPKLRLEVASWSLDAYVKLARNQTMVQACHVGVNGEPETPAVVVSRRTQAMLRLAQSSTDMLAASLGRAGLARVQVEVVGQSFSGAHVVVKAGVRGEPKGRPELEARARRGLKKALSEDYIGLLELTVRHRDQEVTLTGGRDAVKSRPELPKTPEKPPVKAPAPPETAPTPPRAPKGP